MSSETLLYVMPQPSAPIGGAPETNLVRLTFNPGDIQPGDEIEIRATGDQPGTTDGAHRRTRLGTAGTLIDTSIDASSQMLIANSANNGDIRVFKFLDDTHVVKVGAQSTGGSYSPTIGTQPSAVVTIPSLSANTLILSVNAQSAGTTDAVTIQTLSIYHRRP